MAQKIEALEEAAQRDRTIAGQVEYRYNKARDEIAGNTWRGLWDMTASGFGKGVLYAAVAFVAASALVLGAFSGVGWVHHLLAQAGGQWASGAPVSPSMGFLGGAAAGVKLLATQRIGWAMMGIVGSIGGYLGYTKEKAALEEAKAAAFERERKQAIEEAVNKAKEKNQEGTPECHPMYDGAIDGCGHVVQEQKRREARKACEGMAYV